MSVSFSKDDRVVGNVFFIDAFIDSVRHLLDMSYILYQIF